MARPRISQELLKKVLHYSPETGVFTWLVRTSNRVKVGQRAGCEGDGYRLLRVFGVLYLEHVLAWLYVYGIYPERLDHEDGDGTNNRILNLRVCTHSQNNSNTRLRKDNASGYKGVWWHRQYRKWETSITVGGRKTHLGFFDTPEEAYEVRCLAADMLHGEFSNHGAHKCESKNT